MSEQKIVTLIPARGGSKGIRKKNIRDLCGLPLIAYSIIAAYHSKVEEVYVSTDNKEIGQVSETYGAKVIDRPGIFCRDDSPTEEAVSHFLECIECDVIVLIQATSPMIDSEDIDRGIDKFLEMKYDSLFSAVCPEDMLFWLDGKKGLKPANYNFKNRMTRQTRKGPKALIESGAFYIFSKEFFMRSTCRLGGKIGYVEVPFWNSFQVDSSEDLHNIYKLMDHQHE